MGYEKYTEEYTEPYEFGGLNDNKKITATFSHYEVTNINGEMYIGTNKIQVYASAYDIANNIRDF